MIAALDNVQRRRRLERAEDRRQLRRRTERVPAALDEEHRAANVGQVLVPQLIRLAWRMERVPEQDETPDRQLRLRRGHLRGDPYQVDSEVLVPR